MSAETGGMADVVLQLVKRIQLLETNDRAEVAGGTQAMLFAQLPAAGQPGRLVFVTNGRKVGEGAGNGTGVPAYDDGTNWYRTSDDTPVSA